MKKKHLSSYHLINVDVSTLVRQQTNVCQTKQNLYSFHAEKHFPRQDEKRKHENMFYKACFRFCLVEICLFVVFGKKSVQTDLIYVFELKFYSTRLQNFAEMRGVNPHGKCIPCFKNSGQTNQGKKCSF